MSRDLLVDVPLDPAGTPSAAASFAKATPTESALLPLRFRNPTPTPLKAWVTLVLGGFEPAEGDLARPAGPFQLLEERLEWLPLGLFVNGKVAVAGATGEVELMVVDVGEGTENLARLTKLLLLSSFPFAVMPVWLPDVGLSPVGEPPDSPAVETVLLLLLREGKAEKLVLLDAEGGFDGLVLVFEEEVLVDSGGIVGTIWMVADMAPAVSAP